MPKSRYPQGRKRRARFRRLRHEILETRRVLTAPTVAATTPDLDGEPALEAGLKLLKVQFSETVQGADSASRYDLRAAGEDARFDTADDVPVSFTSLAYQGRTASLKFDTLPVETYRLVVDDAITDGDGNVLDGDADGNAGGHFVRTFSIVPGQASKFELAGFPATTTAGQPQNLTVTALDAYGNQAAGYAGTVAFTSNDVLADLPADYTFAAGDAGSHTFSIALESSGTGYWIKATDQSDGFFKSQTGIEVLEAAPVLAGFTLSGYPDPTTAGVSQKFVVAAIDGQGQKIGDYAGTVTFASTDPQASLPADYTFQPADSGDRTFSATFKTAGEQVLSVVDTSDGTLAGQQADITVLPAAASKFDVGGFPSPTQAGQEHDVTVTALDSYGNVATEYAGTVALSSNDPLAVLPADSTFTVADAGRRALPVTLNTGGTGYWIKATDQSDGFFKSQTGIEVLEAAPVLAGFTLTGYPDPTTAGVSQKFVVTAVDGQGQKIDDYAGTVTFASTDPQASLPADYTFQPADSGDRTFSATFKTAGEQVLSVVDTSDGTLAGQQADITVLPAALKSFDVTGYPSPTVAGESHSFLVTARDTYGNVATGYAGTVTFSSSDSNALLPADYTFTPADAGSAAFTATLRNTGSNRSIVATDVATGRTGKQSPIQVLQSWAKYSKTSNNITFLAPVTKTLSDIHFLLPGAPLERVDVDKAIWKLDANIRIENGATLLLHGTSAGGDVNELRLKSENTDDPHATVEIRGDWGNLDIHSTEITSWDSAVGGPDTEYTQFGRSFIRVRSRLDSNNVPRESRMDIKSSEIHHLGFAGSEAYGISYKVLGDPGPNFELYEQVDVFGDIEDSVIHHNYFGVYAFGAFGMNVVDNRFEHNVVYGFDPHDDADQLVIERNIARFNGSHGIICSQRCDHLTIRENESSHNGGNGIMLHRNTNDSLVEDNTVNGNGDSGIALFDSRNNVIRNNVAKKNKHGIRLSVGSAHNLVTDNEFADNLQRGVNFFKGNDAPSPGDDGRPKFNKFMGNKIKGNGTYGIRVRDSDHNIFKKNEFGKNGRKEQFFEHATGNLFASNKVPKGTVLKVSGTPEIPSVLYAADQPKIGVKVDEFSEVVFLAEVPCPEDGDEHNWSNLRVLRTVQQPVLQNPKDADDVTNDGDITPQDVLEQINYLNAHGTLIVEKLREEGVDFDLLPDLLMKFFDTTGDNLLSPRDVLKVINRLNWASLAGEGETASAETVALAWVPQPAERSDAAAAHDRVMESFADRSFEPVHAPVPPAPNAEPPGAADPDADSQERLEAADHASADALLETLDAWFE